MSCAFTAAGNRRLSRCRRSAFNGPGLLGGRRLACLYRLHHRGLLASSSAAPVFSPITAQHSRSLPAFAAPSVLGVASRFASLAERALPVLGSPLVSRLSLSAVFVGLPRAAWVGFRAALSALRRCASLIDQAPLVTRLAPFTASFSLSRPATLALRPAAVSPAPTFSQPHLSFPFHTPAPNPALNRTCAYCRAGRLALR